MTDVVSKLVGALEGMLALDEENHQRYPGDEDVCKEVQAAQAALTAAKAGGWVAVPVEPTPEMVENGTLCVGQTGAITRSIYAAMLSARPLPNPPKEQA